MNFTKQIILLFSVLSLSIFILSCGEGVVPEGDSPATSIQAKTGSSNYIINPVTTYDSTPAIGGITYEASTSGGIESVAGLAIEKNSGRVLAEAINGYVTFGELHAVIALLRKQIYMDENISTINEQIFTKYTEFTVGDYSFTTPTVTTTVDLRNNIANTLAGTAEVLTDANNSAVITNNFRMFVTVTSFNSNYYYTVSVSPDEAIFNENFALMTALSSGTNYTGINERLVSNKNYFKGIAGVSNRTDFLFVIDDSGSMADQQEALSAAADDFGTAVTLAGIDYNIAIITTSDGAEDGSSCTEDCYDRIVKDVGIIDNDLILFKEQIDSIGTTGSATETGIFNSEVALKENGLLNTPPLEFPREDTQLSIIILSDEVSQYDSRAGRSFDPMDNTFIDNNILVNSIVDVGLCANSFALAGEDPNGQYDDLAIATGGLVGNICNGEPNPDFSAVMQNIVFQSSGIYKLNNNYIKPNSIKVSVDGNPIVPSIKNGYMYIEGTNSISFFGTIPGENSNIEVYYEYPKDIDTFSNN